MSSTNYEVPSCEASSTLNTILFSDDQMIFAAREYMLQVVKFQLNMIIEMYNLWVFMDKMKVMQFYGKDEMK